MNRMSDTRTDAVYQQTKQRLYRLISENDADLRGDLANLRRGAGRRPGEDPRVWGILFSELPDDMLGYGGEPSREEWAIYTSLTLYAVHQQGNDPKTHNMDRAKVSLGNAAATLADTDPGDKDKARERIARRFNQIVLASDMDSMAYYLRGFIQLLRSQDVGLDYPRLAKDLYVYQIPNGAASIRLQWGQDFYHTVRTGEEKKGE